MIKVFEAFSGYGSQSLALERLDIDHEVVCISEIDKYEIQAYEALHGQTKNLGDISKIKTENVLDHDLFTYSFPCQDISVAGNQKGLIKGQTRSGLLWECERIIEAKRPKYLLMENVKNLVSKKFIGDFKKWQHKLEMLGYTNYTKVLNAKDYGIPQNRERVFMISILGDHEPYEFPKEFDNGLRLKDFLEYEVDEKYYIAKEKTEKLIRQLKDTNKSILGNINPSGNGINGNVYNAEMNCPTITINKGEGAKVAVPCLTPDRIEKRQNGRRFKENGEPMFTLTGQDRHGVLQIGNIYGDFTGGNYAGNVYDTRGIGPALNTMQGGGRQPHVLQVALDEQNRYIRKDGCVGTLTTDGSSPKHNNRVVIISKEILNKYAVEFNDLYYIIRKLTPRECFRLMGLYDDEIDKIQQAGISNSQQYKLAGNSIVIDVLEALFKQLFLK